MIRQRRDHYFSAFRFINGACTESAGTRFVNRTEFRPRRHDFRTSRQIRPRNKSHQVCGRNLRLVQDADAGGRHFLQVMRRNIRGHTDRNAGRTIEQHIWQSCRQQCRLVHRAVKVGDPFNGPLSEFGQEGFRIGSQTRFRIAHRGEGLRIIGRAEITLTIDDRIAIGEVLRHMHHGFVGCRITMRMKLADHVTNRARTLLVLGSRRQTQLTHRINDAALDRLQAIGQLRQRTVEDDVHRIIEIRLFGKCLEWLAFDAIEIEFLGAHGATSARLPFDSSQSRRSDARFLANNISII